MKKEVKVVPTGNCLLEILTEMEEFMPNSWFFLNSKAINNLRQSYYISSGEGRLQGTVVFKKEANKDYPEIRVVVDIWSFNSEWKPILSISYSAKTFNFIQTDPENIFFFNTAE